MAVIIILMILLAFVSADYWTDRSNLIQSDVCQNIGSSIILSKKEEEVNNILMNSKLREYDEGFKNPASFPPSMHFFHSKSKIEESEVFQIIRILPKGASLHSHDTALVSLEYLYNLTYKDNLYGCIVNGRLQLQFFETINDQCDWNLVKDLRKENSSFDNFLKSQISIIVDDPIREYSNINDVWNRFMQTFSTVFGLLSYRPVFQDYFYQSLKELYEDNVMYVEFRGVLPKVYELNGTTYDPEDVVRLYVETLQKFKEDYPNFLGARFIYAPSRNVNNKTCDDYVAVATKLKKMYPQFIAGFDLVGQEDKGKPLVDFVAQLLKLSETGMKFFFHAAETDWYGTSTDMNLFDAVLLNTTRIGHGYGILKHPQILKEIKNKKIALEISPISNQVLKLVDDLRNHPGAFLVANGFPIVITCDDPTFWGAKALSYDWYMAYMGFASRESNLKFLKQLAINSIEYSAMNNDEKCNAFAKWEILWDKFLDEVLKSNVSKYFYWYSVNKM